MHTMGAALMTYQTFIEGNGARWYQQITIFPDMMVSMPYAVTKRNLPSSTISLTGHSEPTSRWFTAVPQQAKVPEEYECVAPKGKHRLLGAKRSVRVKISSGARSPPAPHIGSYKM